MLHAQAAALTGTNGRHAVEKSCGRRFLGLANASTPVGPVRQMFNLPSLFARCAKQQCVDTDHLRHLP